MQLAMLTVRIHPTLRQRLRLRALKERKTVQQLVTELIVGKLAKESDRG